MWTQGNLGCLPLILPLARHHALYELTSWHVSEASRGKFISSLISLSTPNWHKFASIQSITSVLHERTLGPNPPRDHVHTTHKPQSGWHTERERDCGRNVWRRDPEVLERQESQAKSNSLSKLKPQSNNYCAWQGYRRPQTHRTNLGLFKGHSRQLLINVLTASGNMYRHWYRRISLWWLAVFKWKGEEEN